MSVLQSLPTRTGGPVVMLPADRCEVPRCGAPAVLAISNVLACTSRRVCEGCAGAAVLAEALEPGDPARLTVVRLG